MVLTAEQVVEHGLPTAPPKRSDSRSSGWLGETCQLEALAPDVLAELVRDAIASRVRRDVLDEQRALEREDRLELWRGLPSGE